MVLESCQKEIFRAKCNPDFEAVQCYAHLTGFVVSQTRFSLRQVEFEFAGEPFSFPTAGVQFLEEQDRQKICLTHCLLWNNFISLNDTSSKGKHGGKMGKLKDCKIGQSGFFHFPVQEKSEQIDIVKN